ncbi:MAG: hypothetical protein GXO47_11670 [Chlorobi bacterium]|nr:hypothetical protein [Chlorobiota bacterium]
MMRRRITAIPIFFALISGQNIFSQKDVTGFMEYGLNNARVLSEQYLMPQNKMISNLLSEGWFVTAKVHHPGGFDIKAGINYVFTPSADYLFNVGDMIKSGILPGVTLAENSVAIAPTVSKRFLQGQNRPALEYAGNTAEMPNGSDLNSILSPVITASVGVALNSEISFRYMIPLEDDNYGKATMYGAAFKHSLKSYLPFLRHTPFLQMAIAGNYSVYETSTGVSYHNQPDQKLNIESTGYGGKFITGMDFPSFGFTGTVGYAVSESTFSLEGTFNDVPGESILNSPELVSYSENYIDISLGVFFRFYNFRINASYSNGLYSIMNAGISFEFGN